LVQISSHGQLSRFNSKLAENSNSSTIGDVVVECKVDDKWDAATKQSIKVGRQGWHSSVPPNGHANRASAENIKYNDNPLGLDTPENEIETTPEHRNLVAGDPSCAGWVREFDDPNVAQLRERLKNHNGIRGLEIVSPSEVERAAELFHRDGFVVVADAIRPEQLARMRSAADRAIDEMLAVDPDCSVGGGAGGLPHRYSFGSSSASRHMLHTNEWVELIDMPTTTPIITAIFGSPNYIVIGGGGDIAMPGSIEYQGLHSDNTWAEPHDPSGRITMREMPVPAVTINFPMIDLTTENGPIRQIPGTQNSREPIPSLYNEPEWMKLSTLCPAPAGSAIIRDLRCWHGGTPNLSRDVRAMPNIEYFAPWFRSEAVVRSMPYEQWKSLSPHGQRISRYVMCGKDEVVIGAGYIHPKSKMREAFKAGQLAELGAEAAAEYLRRL
jgi:hypothetical protein